MNNGLMRNPLKNLEPDKNVGTSCLFEGKNVMIVKLKLTETETVLFIKQLYKIKPNQCI